MTLSCAACGAALAGTPRFCPECGTPLVAAAPGREVRKTVTLLFTDVTGSTAMGEWLDPEAYRSVLGRYFAVARAAVERHGGTVEKFVGDAVLAVFGVPEVHEDDALRAVRAASELSAAVRALSVEVERGHGMRLEIRTGVNTGSVVAGAARAGGSFATGDAVNIAARLEQAAGPGEVLLGEATYALVRDAVEADEIAPVVAKGKADPVRAFRLVAVDPDAEGRERRLDAPLVGRDRETRALDDALERTVSSGRGHLVTVLGAPGIGKSRLVSDFVGRVGAQAAVLRGRCVSYGQGITYWPVVQVLRQAAGLDGGESAEVTRHALLRLVGATKEDADAVDLLAPLLGAGGASMSTEETFWAVSHVLEQLALSRPLVVAVDDLHWAEPTLLELLDRVLEETRDLPLLLVCGARPELLDAHPTWGQGSLNASVFGLEPFDADATARSLTAILGPGVPTEVVDVIRGWSGGNPLFVEEIAAHLLESGLLAQGDDGWRVTGTLATAGVPVSVSALLAARLDRLPRGERELLERVSVCGLEFTAAEATLLADSPDVLPRLTSLARRDLLSRRRDGSSITWAFRHVLVRDAAYDALSKAERIDLHARFADYLAQRGELAGAEQLAFVAHHLRLAASYAELLAPRDAVTVTRADAAASAALAAAAEARLRQDVGGAAAILEAALDLRPSISVRREVLLALQHHCLSEAGTGPMARVYPLIAELVTAQGDGASPLDVAWVEANRLAQSVVEPNTTDTLEVALVAADRMRVLARSGGDQKAHLVAVLTRLNMGLLAARVDDDEDELFREIEALGDAQDRRILLLAREGMMLQSERPLTDLLELARAQWSVARSPRDRFDHEVMIAVASAGLGRAGSDELLDTVLGQASSPQLRSMAAEWCLACALAIAGRLDEGSAHFAHLNDRLRADGDIAVLSTVVAWQALLEMERGASVDEAGRMVDEAASITSPHDVLSLALVAAGRAVIDHRRGALHDAVRSALEAIATIDTSEQLWQRADVRRWVSEVWRDVDPDMERRLLTEALDLYARKEILTWRARLESRIAELDA